ncbi:hypothetical protein SDJN02_20534, partial [Cucurbita argyrosperma subsp. argyrosperma]
MDEQLVSETVNNEVASSLKRELSRGETEAAEDRELRLEEAMPASDSSVYEAVALTTSLPPTLATTPRQSSIIAVGFRSFTGPIYTRRKLIIGIGNELSAFCYFSSARETRDWTDTLESQREEKKKYVVSGFRQGFRTKRTAETATFFRKFSNS